MSANPFVSQKIEYFTVFGIAFILMFYFKNQRYNFAKDSLPLLIIVFFVSFELMHKVLFDLDNTKTIFRVLGYYVFSFMAVKALKIKFIETYISLIYFFAVVSLVFYAVSITPGVNTFFYNLADTMFPLKSGEGGWRTPTLIIYTFDTDYFNNTTSLYRNPGFTWEAGAFSFFLSVAMFFNFARRDIPFKSILMNKRSIVMLIALFLTFSTTGYIVLTLILGYFIIREKGFKKYFIVILIAPLLVFSYTSFDFLDKKIGTQLDVAGDSQNRFGSALLDWQDIIKRPLTGWSRDEEVLFGVDANTYATHRPNGLTNRLRTYGFIHVLVYILILYFSFKKYFLFVKEKRPKTLSIIVILIILLSSFSQLLLGKYIIKTFLFLMLAYSWRFKRNTNVIIN